MMVTDAASILIKRERVARGGGSVLAALCLLGLAGVAMAEDVYRTTSPDGRASYSDRRAAPANAAQVKIKVIPADPAASAIGQPAASRKPYHAEPGHTLPRCSTEIWDRMEADSKANVKRRNPGTYVMPDGSRFTDGSPEEALWIAQQRKLQAERCKKLDGQAPSARDMGTF